MTQNHTEPEEGRARHPRYSETLPRTPENAAAARELARTALAAWGQDELIEDAVLIITELVSNAIEHGRMGPMRVIITWPTESFIRLEGVDRPRPSRWCGSTPTGTTSTDAASSWSTRSATGGAPTCTAGASRYGKCEATS